MPPEAQDTLSGQNAEALDIVAIRAEFQRRGKLLQPSGHPRIFQIGRLLFMVRWGAGCWSFLSDTGELETAVFKLAKIERVSGLVAYTAWIWRLALVVGFLGEVKASTAQE